MAGTADRLYLICENPELLVEIQVHEQDFLALAALAGAILAVGVPAVEVEEAEDFLHGVLRVCV